MRPRDILGVVVRGIGIWLIAASMSDGLLAIWKFNGGASSGSVPAGEDVGFALMNFIPGLALILLADLIVWVLYGMPKKTSEAERAESRAGDSEADRK